MPSRIDIGPEGGPFVAINENSNDLELQDINGNVIAKWDETAGQWDLNNNSLTGINAIDASSANVESLSTEVLESTGALTDSTKNVLLSQVTDSERRDDWQPTPSVDDTATAILEPDIEKGNIGASLVSVIGTDSNGVFFDVVQYVPFFTDPVVVNKLEDNEPDGRSYSRDQAALVLAMASGDYQVAVSATTTTVRF